MADDPAQRKAITHGPGPLLVLAGPGSGKTRVLVDRVAWLIREGHVPPEKILVITFTRDAAMEMKKRYLQKEKAGQGAVFGTFHSVFFHILTQSGGYRPTDLVTGRKKRSILKEAEERIGKAPGSGKDHFDRIEGEISLIKNRGGDLKDVDEAVRPIYKAYEDIMTERGLLDLDDLLLKTHRLFLEKPRVLRYWHDRFPYILVDEVQDMNIIQDRILGLLSAPDHHLFLVGDDDQSIYGFRGSAPEIMLHFPKAYPGCEIIALERNYRSVPSIVRASENLIKWNKSRYQKTFCPVRREKEGGGIYLAPHPDDNEEARDIASSLAEELGEGGHPAVLFRNRTSSVLLRKELLKRGIPFSYPEEKALLFSDPASTDLITYLRLASGSMDRSDFLRIRNRPLRYLRQSFFEEKEVDPEKVLRRIRSSGNPRMEEEFSLLLKDIRFLQDLRPFAAINFIRKGMGYDDFIKAEGGEDLLARADDLQTLSAESQRILDFLSLIQEMRRKEEETRKAPERGEEGAGLYTFHGSKGLEFDTVHILDVVEDVTPSKRAKEEKEIEEERRIFYVALTRAQKKVILHVPKRLRSRQVFPSRFLKEMKEDC